MNSITQADIKNKKILVRSDIDVLLDGEIDDFRLKAGLPTLQYIIENEGFPIICGHMGKPKGYDDNLSTKQLVPFFNEHLGENKYKLLENTKFNDGEQLNSESFVKELIQDADLYVNDSFATSHRDYASIVGPPKYLPSFAGLRLQLEVENLSKVFRNPEKPLVAIVGGAKLESKLPSAKKFLQIADHVLLGGKLGLQWTEEIPNKLVIPTDYAQDEKDIGPKTIENFKQMINDAKMIVWAGPMGLYEEEDFILGTKGLANAIAESDAFSIVGGGDTIAALKKVGLLDKMDFVSTGGGAMLTFIVNENLTGIEALEN